MPIPLCNRDRCAMDLTSPNIQSALIAATVTIVTLILRALAKPLWERSFHNFKLESEYKYDQKKRIREAISKYKVPLLNAAESLNHRLWNFSKNSQEAWHIQKPEENLSEKYYLVSFCYRFLLFFALCQKIELELVFLDSTVSTDKDLEMLKYLKFFPQLFCDAALFEGRGYDPSKPKDHFFGDDFRALISKLSEGDNLISFSEFKAKTIESEFAAILNYFSGVSVDQSCNRWQALNAFHFMLMPFLNDYGYDFQGTPHSKMSELAKTLPENALIENLKKLIERTGMAKNKSLCKAAGAMSIR